ncbi:hypothetical protein VaNZ11_015395, partial [Volvox africanus]
VLGPLAACSGADEVVRVVLTWVCNCYSTRHGGGALYKIGSLVNHCCEGNTRYRFVDDAEGSGCGVFVASRRIDPREVITTCYLGWDEQTLISTRMRQKLLVRTKLFTCTCSRCSSRRDPYRSLPCPDCHGGGMWGAGAGSPATWITATTALTNSSDTICAAAAFPGCLGAAGTAVNVRIVRTGSSSGGGNEEGRPPGRTGSASAPDPPTSPGSRCPSHERSDLTSPGRSREGPPSRGAVAAKSGFVYWTGATGDGLTGAHETYDDGSGGGGSNAVANGGGDIQEAVGQPYWECDTCWKRYCDAEMQGQLRRRAAAAGLEADVSNGDAELALEEEVQRMGEHLDWSELAVSLGAVRRLGAQCQAVLGQRHWTTNRCRYLVLELCTAALTRTCASSHTAASAYSGEVFRRPDVSLGGGSWCSAAGGGGGGDGGCGTAGWHAGGSSAGDAGACPLPVTAAAAPGVLTGSAATWTISCGGGWGMRSSANAVKEGISSTPLPPLPSLPTPPPAHQSTVTKSCRMSLDTADMAVDTITGQRGPSAQLLLAGDFESALEAAPRAAAEECARGDIDIAAAGRCGRIAAAGKHWLGAVTTSLGASELRYDAPELAATADMNMGPLTARPSTAPVTATTAATAAEAPGKGGGELGEVEPPVPDLSSSSAATTGECSAGRHSAAPLFGRHAAAPPAIADDPLGSSCTDDRSVSEGPEEAVVAAVAAESVVRDAEEGAGMGPRMEAMVEVGATQGRRDNTAPSLGLPTSPPVTSVPERSVPHVNPHLGRAALLQHTLHHQSLHQLAQMQQQQQQQQQRHLSHRMSFLLDPDQTGSPNGGDSGGGCGGGTVGIVDSGGGGPRSALRAACDESPLGSTHNSLSGAGAGASAASADAAAAAAVAIPREDVRKQQQPTRMVRKGNGMGTLPVSFMHARLPQSPSAASGSLANDVGVSEGASASPDAVAAPVTAPPTREAPSGMSLPSQALLYGEEKDALGRPSQRQQQQDGPQTLPTAPAALLNSGDVIDEAEAGGGVLQEGLGLVSEAGAVRSAGGSTLWSLLEVDGLVDCMCEELQALWQWQQHHTPHAPELVLKAVAGPAATALMDVVKDELCSGGQLSSRALTTAEATAARLAAAYEAAPYYDVSGEAYEEAVSVVQLVPLIRRALDLPE